MIDWVGFGLTLLNNVIAGAISGIFIFYVILPRMGAKTATQTLKAAKKDKDIAAIITKVQEIVKVLEPLLRRFEKMDIDKMISDLQPLTTALKKINPEDVDALLKQLRELTGTVQKAIEKPKIPEP